MMRSLYRELVESTQTCRLTNNKYILLETLEDITWPAVKGSLGDCKLENIIQKARKVIAIIILMPYMDVPNAIKDVLSEGLTDEDLPLSRSEEPTGGGLCSQKSQTLQSRCKKKIFKSFEAWDPEDVKDFLKNQWMFLTPELKLDPSGTISITLENQCALEIAFSSCDPTNKTPNSAVYKCELRLEHQDRFYNNAKLKKPDPVCVALKQFDRHYKKAFDDEKEAFRNIRANSIKSDHLITDLAICDQVSCIIFPWADGRDLEEFWKQRDPRAPDDFLWSFRQIFGLAQALEALHNAGIRHGDLKPQNILYFNENNNGILKIGDLGIARNHTMATEYRSAGTTTKASTKVYQAPEVETEEGPRSRRYDCWSMGCIILEFVVWLLYDFTAIDSFEEARGFHTHTHAYYSIQQKFLQKAEPRETVEPWKKAEVNPMVHVAIDDLRKDPRCSNTALQDLVNLVEKKLLQIDINERFTAVGLRQELQVILQQAENDSLFLEKVLGDRPTIPPIFNQSPSSSRPKTTIDEKIQSLDFVLQSTEC